MTDDLQDWLKEPADYKMTIEQLADTLAKINRFCGRSPTAISVAKHSVIVMLLLPRHRTNAAQKLALMHDAHEAYSGDVPKPVKQRIQTELDHITEEYDAILFPRYGVSFTEEDRRQVMTADNLANRIEAQTLHMKSIDRVTFALQLFANECDSLQGAALRGTLGKMLAWESTVISDRNKWLWWWEESKYQRQKEAV